MNIFIYTPVAKLFEPGKIYTDNVYIEGGNAEGKSKRSWGAGELCIMQLIFYH